MNWLLSLLAPANSHYNRVQLFVRELPTAVLAALVLTVLLALVVYIVGLHRETRAPRALLAALRTAMSLLVIVLLLGPSLELQRAARVQPRVAILVDASNSMALPAAGSGEPTTRFDLARSLATQTMNELQDSFDVSVHTFGKRLESIGLDALPGLSPTSPATDISGALSALDDDNQEGAIAGVVLLSDGADTVLLATPDDVAVRAKSWVTAPVFPIATGEPKIRDLALVGFRHDELGFVRHEQSFDVELRARGFAGQTAEVILRRDGSPLTSQSVIIASDDATIPLRFPVTPTRPGTFLFSVEVVVLPGEVVAANNQVAVAVTVARDQVRTLMICGRPSWDQRFLRHLLKKDPGIDLVSFFILRDRDDLPGVLPDELSLIPFPVNELFTTELKRFDVVILQNFDRTPFLSNLHLENLRDFVVRGGGGLLLIGGDMGMSAGGYLGSALEDVLPFHLTAGPAVDDATFQPHLTVAGEKHFITRLELDRGVNQALFSGLPSFDGTNIVGPLRDDAVALLTHPTRTINGTPMPVFAARSVGEGRTLALTVDSSWYWNFRVVANGGTNRHYVSMWQNAMRWLSREPSSKFIDVTLATARVAPDDVQKIDVRAFGTDYAPLQGARLRAKLSPAGRTGGEPRVVEGLSDGTGVFSFNETATAEGFYRVQAELIDARGDVIDEASKLYEVRTDQTELADPAVRVGLLQAIASATGGRVLKTPSEAASRIPRHEQFRVAERQRIELWDNAAVFALILIALILEWWLRRRSGLA